MHREGLGDPHFLANVWGQHSNDPLEGALNALIDAYARTGRRVNGGSSDDHRLLGAHGSNAKNSNGERLLSLPTNCNKLALTNVFSAHATVDYLVNTTVFTQMTARG